ncbi:hypothetical protein mvi_731 [Megavirus vitis]|nr:hypothetical protein mvi_731 [Megavirus vitis]
MSNYNFQIYLNDVVKTDSHGRSNITFNQDNILIPSPPPGIPNKLKDLVQSVGPGSVSFTYYIAATGSVASHDCFCTYTMMVDINMINTQNQNKTTTGAIGIWSTSHDPDNGGSVNSGWQRIASGVEDLITGLSSHEKSSGSGCWCAFEHYGGWNNVRLSVRIDASVNLLNYCTSNGTNNIHGDMCYNYISDYITKNGANQQITTYMQNYCSKKYPNDGLSIFNQPISIDKKDYNICACNMPDQYYQEFEQSIKNQFPSLDLGSIRPNCLLPACVTSAFKNNELNNCPIPQCLSIVDINNSNIAGPTTINQSQDCKQYGITPNSPPNPNPNPSPNPNPNPNPGPSPVNKNFIDKYKWYILGIIIVLIIIAMIIVIIELLQSKK